MERKPPLGFAGHRINRNTPQKAQLLAIGVDTLHQCIHIRRIALAVELDLKRAAIGGIFVAINGVAHLPQVTAQLAFLVPLYGNSDDRYRG